MILNCLQRMNLIYDMQRDNLEVSQVLFALNAYLSTINGEKKVRSDEWGIKISTKFIKLMIQL